MNTIHKRLSMLRTEMEKLNLDALYISGTDPHSSEYLPERWKTRAFISGFTGSYGTIVVTRKEAGLWTDTRYFIQAQEQLKGTGIEMYKLRVPDAVSPENWMAENLNSGSRVGIDAQTISVSGFTNLRNILFERNIELVQTHDFPRLSDEPSSHTHCSTYRNLFSFTDYAADSNCDTNGYSRISHSLQEGLDNQK